jgi:hypothetical protein
MRAVPGWWFLPGLVGGSVAWVCLIRGVLAHALATVPLP